MGVLAKVSAAYTKLKADNADLQKTIKILELENETLKEILLKRCKTDKEVEREREQEMERERVIEREIMEGEKKRKEAKRGCRKGTDEAERG